MRCSIKSLQVRKELESNIVARRGLMIAKMPAENEHCSSCVSTSWGDLQKRCNTVDPESSRDRRSTWIQMHGKQKPSSPKPCEIDDILQLAPIEAECTTGTECRFNVNCSLKLPLAESCLWSAKKSVGSKVAFPVSRTNVEFPVGWSNWEFRSRNQCSGPGLMNQCRC